jgi:hypothetical protein
LTLKRQGYAPGSSLYSLMPSVQFYRCVGLNLVALVASTAAICLLSAIIVPLAAKLVTAPFVTAWAFLTVRLIVFRPKARGD